MKTKKAFTLIELLLVVALLAFLFALSAKIFVRKRVRVKNTFNEFIQLNNRLSRLSQLNKQSYRLAFDLSPTESDQYWVEKKREGIFAQNSRAVDSRAVDTRAGDTSAVDSQNSDRLASAYQRDPSFYPEPQTLSPLLDIVKIEQKEQSQTDDLVYIYYYPSALAQETKIYFVRPDNKAEWILYLDPVSKELRLIK